MIRFMIKIIAMIKNWWHNVVEELVDILLHLKITLLKKVLKIGGVYHVDYRKDIRSLPQPCLLTSLSMRARE